jgi:hypothetical protein
MEPEQKTFGSDFRAFPGLAAVTQSG